MEKSPEFSRKHEDGPQQGPEHDEEVSEKCDSMNSKLYPYIARIPPSFVPIPSLVPEKLSTGKIHAFHFIELTMKKTLFYLAKAIASHPKLFMMIPFALSISCIAWSFYYNNQVGLETPFDSLYHQPDPTTTLSEYGLKARLYSKNNFKGVNSEFDRISLLSPYEFSLIFSTNRYENITQEIYKEIVKSLSNFSYGEYKWTDICRETCNNTLVQKHILNKQHLFQSYSSSILTLNDSDLIMPDVSIEEVYHDTIFSVINFKLKEGLYECILQSFERFLQEIISNISSRVKSFQSEMFYWSYQQFERDFLTAFLEIRLILSISCGLLILICVAISFRTDSYKSKPFFGLYIGLILVISIIVGYAIELQSSNSINLMSFPAIFMVFTIGLFVLHALDCANSRYSMAAIHPVDKLAFILSWDGPFLNNSLLILVGTSVAIGIFTDIPYIQSVMFLCASSFTMILLFGLLFLTACLFRFEKREAQGIKWYQCFVRGDHAFSTKYAIYGFEIRFRCVSNFDEASAEVLHEKLTDIHPTLSSSLTKLTTCKKSKKYYIAMLVIVLTLGVYGCFTMRVQFDGSNLLKADSNSTKYLTKLTQIYDEDFVEIVFEEPLDYYDRFRRQEIMDVLSEPMDQGYAVDAVSWLMDFENFERKTIYEVNSETFVPVLNYVFLNADLYKRFQNDVVFDKLYSQVLKSRMYLKLSTKGKTQSNKLISEIVQHGRRKNIQLTVKTPLKFSLAHDLQTFATFLWTYLYINALFVVGSFIMFSNISMPIVVLVANLYMTIGVVGYASFIGISFNVFTFTIVLLGDYLMSIISVNFVYNFANSGNRNNTMFMKIQYAFQASFRPTLCSCITLILLNLPLLMIEPSAPFVLQLFQLASLIAIFVFMSFLFLIPMLMMFLTVIFTKSSQSLDKICEESGCCNVEKPVHCVYFLPPSITNVTQCDALENHMNMGTHRSTKPLIQPPVPRMIMAPTSPLPNSPILKSRDFLKDRPVNCPYHTGFQTNDRLNYNNSSTLPRKNDIGSPKSLNRRELGRQNPTAEPHYKLRSTARLNILENSNERHC